MTTTPDIGKILASLKQPGAVKGLLGVGLAFLGTQMAQDAALAIEQRRQDAAEGLDELNGLLDARTDVFRTRVAEAIAQGVFDKAVQDRFAVLVDADCALDEMPDDVPEHLGHDVGGPPESADVARDLPGEQLDPRSCGTCDQEFDNLSDLVDHQEADHWADTLPRRVPTGGDRASADAD